MGAQYLCAFSGYRASESVTPRKFLEAYSGFLPEHTRQPHCYSFILVAQGLNPVIVIMFDFSGNKSHAESRGFTLNHPNNTKAEIIKVTGALS